MVIARKLDRAEREFRTPQSKVRKFSHRAKLPPGTRVEFRTPQAKFCTVRIKVRKFRTPLFKVRNSFQGEKFSVQGVNSLNISFAHHYSRCENFRTMRNTLLAHEWLNTRRKWKFKHKNIRRKRVGKNIQFLHAEFQFRMLV